MNTIIVEDEGMTALFLEDSLNNLNHKVLACFDNAESLMDYLHLHRDIDLIFMDINIKGSMDGITCAEKVMALNPNIGIAFVTSYNDTETINRAKAVSPCGYLIKPIVEGDLEAMLMVLEATKRVPHKKTRAVLTEEFTYDTSVNTLYSNEQLVALTKNETRCLSFLVTNQNNYVSKTQLMVEVWNDEHNKDSSLNELVHRLRKKIPLLPLKNTRNIGYFLTV